MARQPEQSKGAGAIKDKNSRLKTVGLIIAVTMIGKILGLVRDMLLGHSFGTGMESAAFLTASRIPRTFFDAIFAAAISASFIPVFTERLQKYSRKDADRLADSFLTWVGLLTAVFSLLGMCLAKPLVGVLAEGFNGETAALCAQLLRLMFPMVLFTGLAFSMVGILQSMDQFLIPAAMSAVSNCIIILYYIFLCDRFGIQGLAWAFLIGWAAQMLIQIPWLFRHGYRYRPTLRHPALRNVFLLMLPVMVSTWIQPINQLISTRFASFLFEGSGASAMEYANTLYTMITGILVLSITNVIFPEMSRMSAGADKEGMTVLIGGSLRGMLLLLLPMTFGLVLLAEPVVRLLYEYGSWDAFSTTITSRALRFMSLGMVGYGVQNVLSRVYYAGQKGKIPMISGAVSVVVNLLLCILLSDSLDVAGLAIATAVASLAGAAVLLIPTVGRYPGAFDRRFCRSILKMLAGCLVMGLVVWAVYRCISGVLPESVIGRILAAGLPACCGVLTYLLVEILLRSEEVMSVLDRFLHHGEA